MTIGPRLFPKGAKPTLSERAQEIAAFLLLSAIAAVVVTVIFIRGMWIDTMDQRRNQRGNDGH